MKLFLVGMTGDRYEDFQEIVKYSDEYFDGLIFVDHESTDGTKELLEKHKKEGKIISRPYYKQHSHSQNEIIFCRHAKNGDWMFLNDSPERIQPKWLETMREDIEEYEIQGIGGIFLSNRVYLWRYYDCQQFFGSPHWGLNPIIGKTISINEDKKSEYIYNKRDENKNDSYLMHPIKYYYVFNPSNEVQCMFSKYGQALVNQQETNRINFRHYCERKLNLSLENLDDLIGYMRKLDGKQIFPDDYFINFCDSCFRMTDLFRHKVLGQDLVPDIVKNRFNWRLSYYLKTGDKEQLNTDYVGLINRLNKQFGYPPE